MAATWRVNREYEGIEISFDGKPSEEIRNKMKSVGFKWSSAQMKWYAKDNDRTRKVASEIATQDEDVGEYLTFEQKMERDKERAERRQERLGVKAGKLEQKSEALLEQAHKMADVIPFGQPILVGHHSEGRDRRYRGRIHDKFGKAFETQDEAKDVKLRLEGSQALSRKRESPGYMSRKIDQLEAELRKFERDKGQWQGHISEWEKQTNDLKEQITYWKKQLSEAGGLKVTPDDVKAGDEILYLGTWYEVVRVNPKTVTIKNWLNVPTMTWGAEYSKIKEVRHKEPKEEESEKSEPEHRDSTIIKRQIEALGVKVLRAMVDVYNSELIRLTVPTGTQPLPNEVRREVARGFRGLIPSKTWVWFKKPIPLPVKESPTLEELQKEFEEKEIKPAFEVHDRLQKVIDIIKIYRDKGLTFEDLLVGLKGAYLAQTDYVMGSNLNAQLLTDDLKKSGYANLRELWDKIITRAPERRTPLLYPAPQKKIYRYYFLNRPPEVGTMPDNPIQIERWLPMRKTPLGYDALGWADYDRPLTVDEIKHFELFVDEPVIPKLVAEIVKFAHDEGINEAMKNISPDDEYYKAVMAWLKIIGRERPHVHTMAQVRDEIIRLAGVQEKDKSKEWKEAEKILGISFDDYELWGFGTRIKAKKRYGDTFAEDYLIVSKHLTPEEYSKVKPFLKGIEEARIEIMKPSEPLSPEYLNWLKVELHRSDNPIIAESKKNKGFRLFVKSIDEAKKEFVVEKDVYVNHANGIISEMPGTEYNRGKKYPTENFDIMPFSEYLKKEGIKFQYKESLGFKYVRVHWNGGEGWQLEYQTDKKEYHSVNTKNFLTLDEINKLLNSGEAKLYVYDTRGDEFFRWKPFTVPYPEFKWHDYFTEKGKDKFYELLHAVWDNLMSIWMWTTSVTDAEKHYESQEISEPQLKASFVPIERWKVREQDLIKFLEEHDKPDFGGSSPHYIRDRIEDFKSQTLSKFPQVERDKYELILDTLLSKVRAKIEADKQPKLPDTQEIHKRAKAVAEWWFNSQMKNPFTEFYLYHKIGDFRVATETPEGYKISDAQRISPAWTKEQAEQWIINTVQRLPILPLAPVSELPLYAPRIEKENLIKRFEHKGWIIEYKFEWQSAMGYYSGFIWVNRGIGEGIRTAVIQIKSADEIPAEIDKAIAEAEKATQKPEVANGYKYLSPQDVKTAKELVKIGKDMPYYKTGVPVLYPAKEESKEQRLWDDLKDLKVVDFDVIHDINPDKPTRNYYHVYDRTIAILENGKRVQISYVINKGEYGKRAAKAKKEYYVKFYDQYMGKPLSEWIDFAQFERGNSYESFMKNQKEKPKFTFEPVFAAPLGKTVVPYPEQPKKEIIVDTSSKDYKAGYNLAIQGRIAPAVPAWTDQGKADFAQGYKDGQKELGKPVQVVSEKPKINLMRRLKEASTVIELQVLQREIKESGYPEAEKYELLSIAEGRLSAMGVEFKPKVIGGPSKQEVSLREAREKAHEGKKLVGQVSLGGAVSTSAKLGMFEPGAMEKIKAEAEARKRIEQAGLPYSTHPYIQKLTESKESVIKFGSKRGRETTEDIVLTRYAKYCPAETIIDNKTNPKVPERWWVYPAKLRTCISDVEGKIAMISKESKKKLETAKTDLESKLAEEARLQQELKDLQKALATG